MGRKKGTSIDGKLLLDEIAKRTDFVDIADTVGCSGKQISRVIANNRVVPKLLTRIVGALNAIDPKDTLTRHHFVLAGPFDGRRLLQARQERRLAVDDVVRRIESNFRQIHRHMDGQPLTAANQINRHRIELAELSNVATEWLLWAMIEAINSLAADMGVDIEALSISDLSDPHSTGGAIAMKDTCDGAVNVSEICESPKVSSVLHWNIPRHKPLYIARAQEIEAVLLKLQRQKHTASCHVIRGLGGIGKTEFVKQFAEAHRSNYQAGFWIRAGTQEDVDRSIISILDIIVPEIGLEGWVCERRYAERARRTFLTWMESHSHWLLIFDNADDPELIVPYLPRIGGHILVTSRSNDFRCLGVSSPLRLPRLPPAASVPYLLDAANVCEANREDIQAATEIVEAIDGLPLILDEAARFLSAVPDIHAYCNSIKSQGISAWIALAENSGLSEASVNVWQMNVDYLRKHHPASAELLILLAFTGTTTTPFEFLTTFPSAFGPLLGESLERADTDSLSLHSLLLPLDRFSLIDIQLDERMIEMHRIVQAVTQESTRNVQDDTQWKRRIIDAIGRTFAFPNSKNVTSLHRLAPIASTACTYLDEMPSSSSSNTTLRHKFARYLYQIAHFDDAEREFTGLVEAYRDRYGINHRRHAATLHELASVCLESGRYCEAEHYFKQTLALYRSLFGETSRRFAKALHQLASVHLQTEQYEAAESELHRCLDLKRTVYGESHRRFATTLHQLASLYLQTGRSKDSEAAFERCLQIKRATFGESHESYAATLHELASIYLETTRYEEARECFMRCLDIKRTAFGDSHPGLAITLHQLASTCVGTQQYTEAEQFFKQALELFRVAYGNRHPRFAATLFGFGRLYEATGRFELAKEMLLQCTEARRIIFGETHPKSIEASLALEHIEAEITYAKKGGKGR